MDGRADLYSLGVLLYEMLTGSVPFQGEAIEAIYVQHREAPVTPILGYLGVPRSVGNIVCRATAKSTGGRFADGETMSTALEAALTGAANRARRLKTATTLLT